MFPVGSKVLHPCHGAGTITKIQSKCIGSDSHRYYIIHTVTVPRKMQLMVPVNRAESMGLRMIGDASTLRHTLQSCSQAPHQDDVETDYRARQAAVREQLKSGSFQTVASVVRMYCFLDRRKRLGMTDRQMFDSGKEILAGELALACEIDFTEAMDEIDTRLEEMIVPDL